MLSQRYNSCVASAKGGVVLAADAITSAGVPAVRRRRGWPQNNRQVQSWCMQFSVRSKRRQQEFEKGGW